MSAAAGMKLFGDARQWSRDAAVAAACGLFLGVVGPFGSYLNTSRPVVIGYWFGAVLLGELMVGGIVRPAATLAAHCGLRPMLVAACMTALMAVPLSLACHSVALALWPGPIGHIGLLVFYGQTLLVSAGIAAAHAWAAARRAAVPTDAAAGPLPDAMTRRGDFLDRLPVHLGRELIALQMEDHYVRAHTTQGSALILIPLRQAVSEAARVPGLQVHRSWWVARHAVQAPVRDGRNVRLRLCNGVVAPVSRAHVAAVRDAGLLSAAG